MARGVTLRSKGEAWPGMVRVDGGADQLRDAAAAKAAAAAHTRFGDGGRKRQQRRKRKRNQRSTLKREETRHVCILEIAGKQSPLAAHI